MTERPAYLLDPFDRAPDELVVLDPLDVSFPGFSEETFAVLDRLRQHPHIDQYRREKEAIKQHLLEPFQRYRDDLVVNWVLPSGLPFETEKGVFSRLLKNDFGAGGCHHHLWMSFYRPGRRRLTDVQLLHSIWPNRFGVMVFVGAYMKALLHQAKRRIQEDPGAFLALVNPLLEMGMTWHLEYRKSGERQQQAYAESLSVLPAELTAADGIWLRRSFSRKDVLDWNGELVQHALTAVIDLWPVYRFFLGFGA